jgi:hypothetical protein
VPQQDNSITVFLLQTVGIDGRYRVELTPVIRENTFT